MSGPSERFNNMCEKPTPAMVNACKTAQVRQDAVMREVDRSQGYSQPAEATPVVDNSRWSGGSRDANAQAGVDQRNAAMCTRLTNEGHPAAEKVCASVRRPASRGMGM